MTPHLNRLIETAQILICNKRSLNMPKISVGYKCSSEFGQKLFFEILKRQNLSTEVLQDLKAEPRFNLMALKFPFSTKQLL